ncbi:hypothetical protein D3C86_1993210 [compost metagenome]
MLSERFDLLAGMHLPQVRLDLAEDAFADRLRGAAPNTAFHEVDLHLVAATACQRNQQADRGKSTQELGLHDISTRPTNSARMPAPRIFPSPGNSMMGQTIPVPRL